jgi:hypothetical protein
MQGERESLMKTPGGTDQERPSGMTLMKNSVTSVANASGTVEHVLLVGSLALAVSLVLSTSRA